MRNRERVAPSLSFCRANVNMRYSTQQMSCLQATITFNLWLRLCNLICTSAQIRTPSTDMEFTIRPAKKKKHGKGAQPAKMICELAHCPRVSDHCTRWECHQQTKDALQGLENEKLALVIFFDGRVEETKRLIAEIERECDMEAFGSEPLSSSHATYKAGIKVRPATVACDCLECEHKLCRSEVEVMAKRLAVTQDWLATLREYRSKNDLEFLQGQSGHATEYAIHLYLLREPG